MISNTLGWTFANLKLFTILHGRYHPKVIGNILKNKQKNIKLYIDYTINHNENEDDHIDSVSIYDAACLY